MSESQLHAAMDCSVSFSGSGIDMPARVVAIDRFRLTLEAKAEPPEWFRFGRTVILEIGEGESAFEAPVSIVGTEVQGDPHRFTLQLRKLRRLQLQALEKLLGVASSLKMPTTRRLKVALPVPTRKAAPPRPAAAKERRAYERFEVDIDLWVEHEGTTFVMKTVDISRGGMRCEVLDAETPDWIKEGARARMELFPPEQDSVAFRGRITRVNPGSGHRRTTFGVAFENIAAQVKLNRILRELAQDQA